MSYFINQLNVSLQNIHSNIPSVTECLDQDARPDDADRIAGSDSTMQGGVDYNTEVRYLTTLFLVYVVYGIHNYNFDFISGCRCTEEKNTGT